MQIYYPEITLEVNEPFAIKNPYAPSETPLLVTYEKGLHLVFYTDTIEQDLPIWGTHTLGLGMTEYDSIPFMVLTFENSPLTLVYALNVFGIIGDERGPWLRSASTDVNILLVDNKTGKLASVRELKTKLLYAIRQVCKEQQRIYPGSEQVAQQIEQLLNPPKGQQPVTAEQIYNRSLLSNLFVSQYPVF